jgi:hypothetical protein
MNIVLGEQYELDISILVNNLDRINIQNLFSNHPILNSNYSAVLLYLSNDLLIPLLQNGY